MAIKIQYMFPMMKEIKNISQPVLSQDWITFQKKSLHFLKKKQKKIPVFRRFQIDEEAFLYLNFNETPQPSLRELEKMVKEIQVAEVNEEEEEKEDRPAARYATG